MSSSRAFCGMSLAPWCSVCPAMVADCGGAGGSFEAAIACARGVRVWGTQLRERDIQNVHTYHIAILNRNSYIEYPRIKNDFLHRHITFVLNCYINVGIKLLYHFE